MSKNGLQNVHYHNSIHNGIKSTGSSAVYTPTTSIINAPLDERYTVGENIGRGKFAVVKKCVNKETGEVVAAKFIKKRRRGKSCREDILREVVMLEMALDHPRLVNLKEVYETQSELILITEYCAGGELFTECILEEKFNEADVRLLMAQILEGLVYLHEKSIVHLDLKPQNILLTDEFPKGSIKICDLGFACLVNSGEDIRDIIGTPDYVAPEVLNYDSLGLYTDMWSLGVLTYVMLTTCSPFAADDKLQTFANITTVNLEFPDDLFADISLVAQDFIKKLLLLDPRDRMTAKECFNHEWVAGALTPSKHLTLATDAAEVENDLELELPSEKDTQSGKAIVKSDSRDEVQDETSVMSIGDVRDVDTIGDIIEADTVDDLRDTDTIADGRDSDTVGDVRDADTGCEPCEAISSESQLSVITVIFNEREINREESQSRVTTVELDDGEVNIAETGVNIEESDVNRAENDTHLEIMEIIHKQTAKSEDSLRSPDTDSSMCLSENRLQDTDSGIMTGSDSRSARLDFAQNHSGRSSTDLELSSEREFDMGNTADNEDSEMLNKSMIESEIKEFNVNHTPGELATNPLISSESETKQYNSLSKDVNCPVGEMEDQSDMDHSGMVDDMAETPGTSELNSSSSTGFVSKEHSNSDPSQIDQGKIADGFDDAEMVAGEPSVEFKHPEQGIMDQGSPVVTTSDSFTITRTEPKGRLSSVSNIDETINSMQLGERHKRELPSSSRAGNPENTEEIEYEFISVSKRVKSYEETLSPEKNSPAKSPQFSPKIPRSPRVGRPLRNHHQQH